MKIAYIVDSFPGVSTTFVVDEIYSVVEAGVDCHVFSLLAGDNDTVHPRARTLMNDGRVSYFRRLNVPDTAMALVKLALRNPVSTLRTLNRARLAGANRWIARDALSIVSALQGHGFTHLHAHFADRAAQTAMWVSRWTGIPFTFTTHRYDVFETPPDNITELIDGSHGTVCISHFNKQYIVSHFHADEAKLEVIRCGIYVKDFEDTVRVPASGSTPVRLLCVARLEPMKGHSYLLHAIRLLCLENINVELSLIGDGRLRNELSALAVELGVAHCVRFWGAQTASEVRKHLKACDIVVLGSLSEGVPVAAMEGMASGRAVVATAVGSVSELVEDRVTGFLCAPKDPECIARTVKWIRANPQKASAIVAAGKQRVSDEFDRERSTQQLLGLWSRRFD